MEYDQNSVLTAVTALNRASVATDTTTVGTTIDTAGFEAITFIPLSGVITDGSFAFKLYEDDASGMGTENEVAAADILGSLPTLVAADDQAVKQFGYRGKKRYVRIKVVSTGTTSGGVIGAVAVKGMPAHAA